MQNENPYNICRHRDCDYYSTFTDTCDYMLLNFRRRPCAIDDCTEYREREKTHTWMRFWPVVSKTAPAVPIHAVPEPPLEPPEPHYVVAQCGHEVYDGEYIFTLPSGETLCPDCFDEMANELCALEKARLMGCSAAIVVAREVL
ncbi:MAG: hypothetical protein LBN02_05475 [Oscillospiraceae bacterium]|jgi:hypothetical protein|nr:hypothetical protein [Oscillospiraceae bacterium]